MPIYASAFFVPTSASIPYILEDLYQKGGYRSVATIVDRDAIKTAARKQGMLCYVREDTTIYWLPDAVIAGAAAWKVLDVTKYVNYKWKDPLSVDDQFNVSIDEKRLVPLVLDEQEGFVLLAGPNGTAHWVHFDPLPSRDNATKGMALTLDASKNMIWSMIDALPPTDGVAQGSAIVLGPDGPKWGAPASKERTQLSVTFLNVGVGETKRGIIATPGASLLMFNVSTDKPNVEINLHGSSLYNDPNPFTFISSVAKLSDDGQTVSEDGTVIRHRRFSIYANFANEKQMFIEIKNEGASAMDIGVAFDVLPLE